MGKVLVMEQKPFGEEVSLAMNPEPRCPCVLLLDVSGSMQGSRIEQLNAGLIAYKDQLAGDTLAAKRVEVAVVTFGGQVTTVSQFTTAETFIPTTLSANGDTPMGAAIQRAIDMLQERKTTYRSNGINFYRPWMFLITDGAPTDEWQSAAERVKQGESSKAFSFFCVGVEGADMNLLKQISVREPLKLQGLQFREMFVWLSNSQKSVSRSKPGDEVGLVPPSGWAKV
jgi:uncharacterized protein YegL